MFVDLVCLKYKKPFKDFTFTKPVEGTDKVHRENIQYLQNFYFLHGVFTQDIFCYILLLLTFCSIVFIILII